VVSRFRLDGEGNGDAGSEEVLFVVAQPNTNHNGGQLHFGPGGFLYVGFGDGGSGNDPGENAQDLALLLGKMLRIDVEGDPDPGLRYAVPETNPFVPVGGEVRPEIWAYGLRNPWRWSFDRATGDLYIGDVGQGRFEEIDFVPAASLGGEDYGWDFYEAEERRTDANSGPAPAFDQTTGPVFSYGRSLGQSVTGGYVYRGGTFPRMAGKYFFGDYQSGRVWAVQRDAEGEWQSWLFGQSDFNIASFGEDESGELYLADLNGSVYRVEDVRDAEYLRFTSSGYLPGTSVFAFTWGAETGESYQVQRAGDLGDWEDVGGPVVATPEDGRRLTFEETDLTPQPDRRFYRVGVLAP
jgi:glucose/arabinose dehydrogenase